MLASTKRCTRSGLSLASLAEVWISEPYRMYPLLLDRERLARQIALLDCLRIGEERRHAEGVGSDLLVGVAEFLLQKEPDAGSAVAADHDRLALQRRQGVAALPRMRDQYRRVLLEQRGDRNH